MRTLCVMLSLLALSACEYYDPSGKAAPAGLWQTCMQVKNISFDDCMEHSGYKGGLFGVF